MAEQTFEEGYRDGWESVAGTEPMPDKRTPSQDGDLLTYECGFRYGASDAAERFKPGSHADSPEPV
jgi:hypothetical protein